MCHYFLVARPRSLTDTEVQEAAFAIARAEGLATVTARRLAAELDCSVQPIYTAAGSMGRVHAHVRRRAAQWIEDRLHESTTDLPAYLALGLATLDLACREPQLWAIASSVMLEGVDRPPPGPVLAAMRADPRLTDASADTLTELHGTLSMAVQGAAWYAASAPGAAGFERAAHFLTTVGEALIDALVTAPGDGRA